MERCCVIAPESRHNVHMTVRQKMWFWQGVHWVDLLQLLQMLSVCAVFTLLSVELIVKN